MIIYFYSSDVINQTNKLIQEGKYEAAITLLKEEIPKKPNDLELYLLLADCYLRCQNYEDALKQYNKVKDQELIHDKKGKTSLMYNVADAYFNLKQYDNVFGACLQILQTSPGDLKAVKIIAFMLLGNARFRLAIPYLKRLMELEPDDSKNERAYAVALYEVGETERAMELVKRQIEDDPGDMNLKLLYLGMCSFHNRQAGIDHLQDFFFTIKDEAVAIFLIRLYCFMLYNIELHPAVLEFLEKRIDDPVSRLEVKRECTYFLIFFLLRLRNAGEAERWINTFEESYGNYRQLKKIKASIGMDVFDTGDIIDFESLYKEEFQSLFSEEMVYKLSGLKTDQFINIDKFFQESEDNELVLNPAHQQRSMDLLLEVFCHLTKEDFLKFTEKACKWLHFKIINMAKHLDEQSIDYLCEHPETSEKLVVSFKQFKKNANVSDIFLNDLLAKLHEYEVNKVMLIANGELTEAAQGKLRSTGSIEVLQGVKFRELLQETLGSVL